MTETIITVPETDLLAVLGESGEHWVKGQWEKGDAMSEPKLDTRGDRESDPPGAEPEDLAYELGWVALGEVLGDDDGCEAARAIGQSLMESEQMQAIKTVLRHLAVLQAMEVKAPTSDVLRLLGLPDLAVEWVLS